MVIFPDQATAARARDAIKAMLKAVGAAQSNHLHASPDFHQAEARIISVREVKGRWILHIEGRVARQRRGGSVSWVLLRLIEVAEAEAEVSPTLRPQVSPSGRATGVTLPKPISYYIPGAGSFRLPGPYNYVDIPVATVHPLTHESRSILAIGRSLVHELIIHAWRDILFYQPRPYSTDPHASPGAGSSHRDASHTTGRRSSGRQHNYADAEADLLDYYYDLAVGHSLEDSEANHTGFSRSVQLLGGIMGTNISFFRQYRRATAEYSEERARFLEQARAFAVQRRHVEALERNMSR